MIQKLEPREYKKALENASIFWDHNITAVISKRDFFNIEFFFYMDSGFQKIKHFMGIKDGKKLPTNQPSKIAFLEATFKNMH